MTSILIYTLAGASAALFVRWLLQVPKVKDNDHSWLDRGSRLSLSTIPGRRARPGQKRIKSRWAVNRNWITPLGTVPAGFVTDAASIPRWLWPFIGHPFCAEFIEAAVLHDWLYSGGFPFRKLADWTFYRLLVYRQAGRLRARLMWGAVRVFGRSHWKDA